MSGGAGDRPRIVLLDRTHDTAAFDCGKPELNRFLARFALGNQTAGSARTYVAAQGVTVAGYYSLAVGEVAHEGAAERLAKGLSRHPIPVMILARMAVGNGWQGRGLGAALLKDALLRTVQAADIAGIRAIVVHAKDDEARTFYERFDFEQSPTDPLHLFLLLKDLRKHLGATV